MIFWKVIYLLLVFEGLLVNAAKLDAYFTKLECVNHYPKVVADLNCHLNQTFEGRSSANGEFRLTRDIYNVTVKFIFTLQRGKSILNHTNVMIDTCSALGALHTSNNIVLKIIADEVRKASNFPLQCPFKKNTLYYLRDYTIDPNALPSYTPDLAFIVDSTFYTNKRKMLNWINWGNIRRKP